MNEVNIENILFSSQPNPASEIVGSALDQICKILNDKFKEDVLYFSKSYAENFNIYHLCLGSKVSEDDLTTLLACRIEDDNQSVVVDSPLIDGFETSYCIISDGNVPQQIATQFRKVLVSSELKEKIYIYNRLYKKKSFSLTIFVDEFRRYIPNNILSTIFYDDVKNIKNGDSVMIKPNRRMNSAKTYKGEVNGIIVDINFSNEKNCWLVQKE